MKTVEINSLPHRQRAVVDAARRVRSRGQVPTTGLIAAELGEGEDNPAGRNRVNSIIAELRKKGRWPAEIQENGSIPPAETQPQPGIGTVRRDPEIVAMEAIVDALDGLHPSSRRRVAGLAGGPDGTGRGCPVSEPVKVRSNSRSFRSRSNGDITVRLYPEDYAALETLGKTLSPIVPLPVSDLIRYMIRNFPLHREVDGKAKAR